VVIRFSHVVARDTPKGLAVERFKSLVEQRSGGRIRVAMYPAARLYSDLDEMEALRLGAVEMLAPSLSKFGPIGFPEFELFDLPFLFERIADVHRVTQGEVGSRLLDSLARQGLVGLGFFDNGFKQMSANRPLREPGDFNGLRMRVQASRVIAAQFKALGARPVVLAFSETRRALAAGVVDGTENPWSNIYSKKFHEVQGFIMDSNHGILDYMVITNAKWWNGLPADVRTALNGAMQEAITYGNRIAEEEGTAYRAKVIADNKGKVLPMSKENLMAWRTAMKPVWKKFEGEIGVDLIQAAEKANK